VSILQEQHLEDKWVFVIYPQELFDISKTKTRYDNSKEIEGALVAPIKDFPEESCIYAQWYAKSWSYESAKHFAEIVANSWQQRLNIHEFINELRAEKYQKSA